MPDREQIDEWFGHPGFDQQPSLPVARKLDACPDCGWKLKPERPSLSCPNCGRQLDDSPVGRS